VDVVQDAATVPLDQARGVDHRLQAAAEGPVVPPPQVVLGDIRRGVPEPGEGLPQDVRPGGLQVQALQQGQGLALFGLQRAVVAQPQVPRPPEFRWVTPLLAPHLAQGGCHRLYDPCYTVQRGSSA